MLLHYQLLLPIQFNSFVRAFTVFADLYNFFTVWHSNALTVHTEFCSLVLTVNCCKTEKLLTVVQLCSSFRGIAKFTVKYNLTRVTYLRFLDALFGTAYWRKMRLTLLCSQFFYSNSELTLLCSQFSFTNYWMSRNLFERCYHADTVFL